VLWLPYYDVNGVEHVVHLAGIDSQGHRTREVYDWCIRNRGRTLPINGERRLKQPYTLANLENYPGTSVKIPGGLRLLHVHTKYYKDALHRKLSIAPADPGAWHMNAECTTEWAKQLCAEYVDDLGNWSCPKGRDNHAWDVSVYGLLIVPVKWNLRGLLV
jgi:phage terminase large subunit GpA-like protein